MQKYTSSDRGDRSIAFPAGTKIIRQPSNGRKNLARKRFDFAKEGGYVYGYNGSFVYLSRWFDRVFEHEYSIVETVKYSIVELQNGIRDDNGKVTLYLKGYSMFTELKNQVTATIQEFQLKRAYSSYKRNLQKAIDRRVKQEKERLKMCRKTQGEYPWFLTRGL